MKLQEIKFKIKSKIRNYLPKKLGRERPSSYPFISGDTFRAICDFHIETEESLNEFVLTAIAGSKIKSLFISLSYINNNEKIIIEKFNKVNYSYYSEIKLILHNGDNIPNQILFDYLSKLFKKIYCVNLDDKSKKMIPIPIGLENYHYFRNGKLEDLTLCDFRATMGKKDIVLSSCFSLATNYSMRNDVYTLVKNSRFKCVAENLDRKKYIKLVKNSFFTLSPPGNGNDCHRTWEAIYLNTIPIVLNGYLSKFLCNNLPIYSVNSYSEILNKTDEELKAIYFELMGNRNRDIAFFYYWQQQILSDD